MIVSLSCAVLSLPAILFSTKEARKRILLDSLKGALYGVQLSQKFVKWTSPLTVPVILLNNKNNLNAAAVDAISSVFQLTFVRSMLGYSLALLANSLNSYHEAFV